MAVGVGERGDQRRRREVRRRGQRDAARVGAPPASSRVPSRSSRRLHAAANASQSNASQKCQQRREAAKSRCDNGRAAAAGLTAAIKFDIVDREVSRFSKQMTSEDAQHSRRRLGIVAATGRSARRGARGRAGRRRCGGDAGLASWAAGCCGWCAR